MPTKLWLRSCLEKLILLRFLCIVLFSLQDGSNPSRVATDSCYRQWVACGAVLLACTLNKHSRRIEQNQLLLLSQMPTKSWLLSCLEKLILLRFLCVVLFSVQDGSPSRVANGSCCGQWVAGGVVMLSCTLNNKHSGGIK
jgi:hypothetical protein